LLWVALIVIFLFSWPAYFAPKRAKFNLKLHFLRTLAKSYAWLEKQAHITNISFRSCYWLLSDPHVI